MTSDILKPSSPKKNISKISYLPQKVCTLSTQMLSNKIFNSYSKKNCTLLTQYLSHKKRPFPKTLVHSTHIHPAEIFIILIFPLKSMFTPHTNWEQLSTMVSRWFTKTNVTCSFFVVGKKKLQFWNWHNIGNSMK